MSFIHKETILRKTKRLLFIQVLYCLPIAVSFGQDTDALSPVTGFSSASDNRVLEISAGDPRYQEGLYKVRNYLYILPDSLGQWTIEDMTAPAFADRFTWGKSHLLNKTHPDVAWFWVRLTLEARVPQPEQWLIHFGQREVILFEEQADGNFSEKRTGAFVPFSERYFDGRYGGLPILPVPLIDEKRQTFFFRIKTIERFADAYWGALDGSLTSSEYVTDFAVHNRVYHTFILGVLWTVALYHLIFFFYNRQRAYLYFSLFVFSHSLVALYFNGFAVAYFAPEDPALIHDYLFYIAVAGFIVFLLLFSSEYLKLNIQFPGWQRVLQWPIGAQIIYSIVMIGMRMMAPSWYGEYVNTLLKIYTLCMAIVLFLLLIIGIVSLRKGFRPARVFLIAIGLSIAQQMINVLSASTVVDIPNFMTGDNGSVLGMLVFAIGLGQRFKQIQDEKIRAEVKQKEEQKETKRLIELDEFKSRFYTNITHEFRTPLTVIQGLADEIRENPRWKTQERVDLIKNSSSRLLQLINQLLDLSKLEAGKLEPEYVEGDIIRYLSYLVESFHSLAHSQNVTLSFHAESESLLMDYDPEKYQQVFGNLIANAIKFTPEYGKVKVAAKVVEEEGVPVWLEVEVKDTGRGIPQEKLPFIFDRFYQASSGSSKGEENRSFSSSDAQEAGGTGLGLSLVKELLTLMGGSIQVQSEVGRGTTFTCRLPVRNEARITDADPTPESHVARQERQLAVTHDGPKSGKNRDLPIVLIVEDNQDVIYYLRSCLESGYLLYEARNGREGLALAFEQIPDLVISDVMMPEMDGFELCRNLKTDERTSHIPVILLTAKVTQTDKMEGLQHGADAYLTKPFQKEELLLRLNNLLELRRQMQRKYQSVDSQSEELEDPFLQKARRLIEDHLDDPDFGVIPLSRALGMSRVQVHRKLKALTDVSTSQFIRHLRLQRAYELLKDPDLTIAEVGYQVGYKDPAHFSRSFSQRFGVAPREMRG